MDTPKRPSPLPLILLGAGIILLGLAALAFDRWRDASPASSGALAPAPSVPGFHDTEKSATNAAPELMP